MGWWWGGVYLMSEVVKISVIGWGHLYLVRQSLAAILKSKELF